MGHQDGFCGWLKSWGAGIVFGSPGCSPGFVTEEQKAFTAIRQPCAIHGPMPQGTDARKEILERRQLREVAGSSGRKPAREQKEPEVGVCCCSRAHTFIAALCSICTVEL